MAIGQGGWLALPVTVPTHRRRSGCCARQFDHTVAISVAGIGQAMDRARHRPRVGGRRIELEAGDLARQRGRIGREAACGGGRHGGDGGILLSDAVHLGHRGIDLLQSRRLLLGRGGDLRHQAVDLDDPLDDPLQRLTRFVDQGDACLHLRRRRGDARLDVARRIGGALRERARFRGDDREATAGIARPRRLVARLADDAMRARRPRRSSGRWR